MQLTQHLYVKREIYQSAGRLMHMVFRNDQGVCLLEYVR